jgi:pre-mRNA-splicing factor SYF1
MRGGETCLRIWRRYIKVDPSLTERYVRILEKLREEEEEADEEEDEEIEGTLSAKEKRSLEAAKTLLRLAMDSIDGKYVSPEGKSSYNLLLEWLELCEKYSDEVGMESEEEKGVDLQKELANLDALSSAKVPVSKVIRDIGLVKFPDQAGRLWTGLATYWIRRGDFDTARDIFEEGMAAVLTIRDFTQIFDAYAETSENVIGYLMDELGDEGEKDEDDEDDEGSSREDKEANLDKRMKDFEELMERRPFLVNDVLLRRNPNDVQEWEKRVVLYGEDDEKVIETYKKAIETVNPRKATANHHHLYINFARFYEAGGSQGESDLDSARGVLEKGTTIPFKKVDDLADIWCEWAEMEIRNKNFEGALRIMSRASSAPKTAAAVKAISFYDESIPVQKRLFKSSKFWSFYIDLEESIGSIEGTREVYDKIIDLKIATPQNIINYANFLEEHKYFEESYKVYERGIEVFTYPVAFEIWNIYLSKFVKRYGATKLERARDLFEQALEKCPEKFCRPIFLMYGKLEEEFGLGKRAMKIYERATEKVSNQDKFNMFIFYIAKVASNFGLAATRPVYEKAIEVLPDLQTSEICLRFANLELKLGEIDRARAIFAHASQFCDPRSQPKFWKEWNAFEIDHGSEDTFREMLRIKRSIQAQFNTDVSYIAAYAMSAQQRATAEAATAEANDMDPMARAEREAAAATSESRGAMATSFVAAKQTAPLASTEAEKNEEELDDDDDDDLM